MVHVLLCFWRNSFLQFLLNCVCRLPVCVSTTHLGLQHDESAIVCRWAKGTKSVMNSSVIHLTHLDLFVAWDLSGAVWPVLTGLRTTPLLACFARLRWGLVSVRCGWLLVVRNKKSSCVREVEKIKQRRTERRAAQTAMREQNVIDYDVTAPSWEFEAMIRYIRHV